MAEKPEMNHTWARHNLNIRHSLHSTNISSNLTHMTHLTFFHNSFDSLL